MHARVLVVMHNVSVHICVQMANRADIPAPSDFLARLSKKQHQAGQLHALTSDEWNKFHTSLDNKFSRCLSPKCMLLQHILHQRIAARRSIHQSYTDCLSIAMDVSTPVSRFSWLCGTWGLERSRRVARKLQEFGKWPHETE